MPLGRVITATIFCLFSVTACDNATDPPAPPGSPPPAEGPATDDPPMTPPGGEDPMPNPPVPDPTQPPPNDIPPPPDPTPDVVKRVCGTGSADFTTLGAAIAAVPSGARLELCAGTYRENVVIDGKALHIRGAGANATTVDAAGVGPGIVVRRAPGSGLALEGLTVKNARGGGLVCEGSGLSVMASAFVDNISFGNLGGGVYAVGCAVSITGTRFEHNQGGERGGGLFLVESSGEIVDSVIVDNSARYGGGLSLEGGTVALRRSDLRGNRAAVHGGGLHSQSDGTVEDNVVQGNSAGRKGGGLYFNLKAPIIQHNTVTENTCIEDGSGIFVGVGTALVFENTMTANSTQDDGGGLRLLSSATRVERNMIVGNHAVGTGGGIKVSHMHATLVDNVIQGNVSESSGGGLEMDNDSSVVRGGLIAGNTAAWRGGGIHGSLFPFRTASISDVVITGNKTGYGGGILLEDNFYGTQLHNLTVTANTARVGGGFYFSRAEFTVTHSVLSGNKATTLGGGMVVGLREDWKGPWPGECPCPPAQTPGTADFLTIYGNDSKDGAGLWTDSAVWTLRNSIIAGNLNGNAVTVVGAPIDPPPPPPPVPGEPPPPPPPAPTEPPPLGPPTLPTWRYNNTFPATFVGVTDPTGVDGNVTTDPMFMDPPQGDFKLAPQSACVNAGDPNMHDTDGTRADMGRFGGVPLVF